MIEKGEISAEALEALERSRDVALSPSNLERLSRIVGEELARWAFGQWDLRKRARAKFEKADEMLFDRDGLEMASHEEVARFHAYRFPPGSRVADLTCGIGADLIALAREGPAIGYEIDPRRAALARHNLRIHGLDAEVRCEDSLDAAWDFDCAFADPSRRPGGIRTLDPERFEPNLRRLAERMWSLKVGAIKLSPMLPDEVLAQLGAETIFLSHGGECREAIVLLGSDFIVGGEKLSGVWAFQARPSIPLAGGDELPPQSEDPGPYIMEADPAAIRAHALPELCRLLGAMPLGDSNGYLTAEEAIQSTWARSYRVLAYGHADLKRIREKLRSLDGRLTDVKVRGVREEPTEWLRKTQSNGMRDLVLMLYGQGKSVRFAIVSRED